MDGGTRGTGEGIRNNMKSSNNRFVFQADARNPNLILYALFTLEKFALTSDNKVKITKKLVAGPEHLLLILQRRINDEDNTWAQVGFCAQWALDNTCEYRHYTIHICVYIRSAARALYFKNSTDQISTDQYSLPQLTSKRAPGKALLRIESFDLLLQHFSRNIYLFLLN